MFNNKKKKETFIEKVYRIKENCNITITIVIMMSIFLSFFVGLESKPSLEKADISDLKVKATALYESRIPGNTYEVKSNDSKYTFKITDSGVEAKNIEYMNTLVGSINEEGKLTFEVSVTTDDTVYIVGLLIRLLVFCTILAIFTFWILTNLIDMVYKWQKT